MRAALLALSVVVLLPCLAPAQQGELPPMWTMQDYRDVFMKVSESRSEAEVRTLKIAYMRGIIEGAYFAASRAAAPEANELVHDHFFSRCLVRIGGWVNVLALFDKWVEEHPDSVTDSAAYRLLRRTEAWCRNNGVE